MTGQQDFGISSSHLVWIFVSLKFTHFRNATWTSAEFERHGASFYGRLNIELKLVFGLSDAVAQKTALGGGCGRWSVAVTLWLMTNESASLEMNEINRPWGCEEGSRRFFARLLVSDASMSVHAVRSTCFLLLLFVSHTTTHTRVSLMRAIQINFSMTLTRLIIFPPSNNREFIKLFRLHRWRNNIGCYSITG